MKTVTRGWCAWHKDWGLVPDTFDEGLTAITPENKAWLKLLDFFHGGEVGILRRKFEIRELKKQGWKVRPCTMTIQATDMSVTEMRELHGISSEDRKGSKDEVNALSGRRVEGEE